MAYNLESVPIEERRVALGTATLSHKLQPSPGRLVSRVIPILALLSGLLIALPLIFGFVSSFKTMAEFSYPPKFFPEDFAHIDNYREVYRQTPIMRFMFNSFAMAVLGTIFRMLFAVMAAYAFAYLKFRGKYVFFMLILGTMMIPGETMIVGNYLTVSRLGMLNTYRGMVITYLVGASQILLLRQHFKTLPPALFEAAQLDGCGDIFYILRILLPMSRSILFILTVQTFIGFWNSYLWPLLITNRPEMRTVQVGITMLTSDFNMNYSLVMAAVTIVLIPTFILFFLMRKNIVKGISTGIVVG